MLFNSITFLIFFAVVLGLHYLPLAWKVKKFNLLIASYLFYAAWNPPFILLLWLSTIVDWQTGKWIGNSQRKGVRRSALAVSLGVNLGMLAFFKYGNFGLENFVQATRLLGIYYEPLKMDILLPVGISFYTFQTLSYTIDIYRGKMRPWHSFLDYALYVTFFPQLVAGPIVRAVHFLPQCIEPARATPKEFGWGINLLLIGLFQKVVVADYLLAPSVELAYSAQALTIVDAWLGTLAFAGQIFCDFAGYSTCAIGAAMCLGFAIPENFRYPYAAIGFSDFWRRWHISLSSWLRDYLYIPMGGNRVSVPRKYFNLMATMLIGGLWHGAAWTFVVWGGLHGLYLIAERWATRQLFAQWRFWKTTIGKILLAWITFLCVCFAWVFFRGESFEQSWRILSAMFGFDSSVVSVVKAKETVLVTVFSILGIHWMLRDTTLEAVVQKIPTFLWILVNVAMLIMIITMRGQDQAFIYFQF